MRKEIKTIFLTGSNGFIGSSLKKQLINDGYNVICSSKQDGDIATNAYDLTGVDHVFHLAAETYVPESWENPISFYKTNVLGTVNILDACKKFGCSVTIPSTYMYGNPSYLPIDEQHPIDRNVSPYHNSKYITEVVCEFYSNAFNVDCTILRLFNVYGCGQRECFLIPHLINELLNENEKLTVKDLKPKRDYVYIKDVVEAFAKSMNDTGNRFRVYNIGYGESYSVKEIIEFLMDIYNLYKPIVSLNEHRKNDISDSVADISKIKRDLHWEPKFNLYNGLTDMKNELMNCAK